MIYAIDFHKNCIKNQRMASKFESHPFLRACLINEKNRRYFECAEDENGWDGYIERQLRFLVRRNKQRAYIFQEDKIMRIAAELQLNYGL